MIRGLLYHDVVPQGEFATSGFRSPDADIYKFSLEDFDGYLAAFEKRGIPPAASVFDALATGDAFLLTFDDGGASAIQWIADRLERLGHIGHFFIVTDYIGTPGFLSRAEIAELARRGHVIGSHSCSHPPAMARCAVDQLEREWHDSAAILAEILGSAVTVASVPAGSYSSKVGEAAARAGIRFLFTSEPVSSIGHAAGCALIGRYSVQRGISFETAAAMAAGDRSPRFHQYLYWNFKKVLKRLGGNAWMEFRRQVLARRAR